MNFEIIHTERLLLRKLDRSVLDSCFKSMSDTELLDFFGLSTKEELQKEKDRYRAGYATFNKSFLWFQIIEKGKRTPIGWCGFHTWYFDHFRAELGYGINEAYRHKGFMKEALNAVLQYGFNEMKLNRVEAFIADYNIASLKLLERFGFQKEGVLKEHYYVEGIAEDSHLYALLRSHWA